MKSKEYNPKVLGELKRKWKWQPPGIMTIIIFLFLIATIIELLLAYFLYETYNYI